MKIRILLMVVLACGCSAAMGQNPQSDITIPSIGNIVQGTISDEDGEPSNDVLSDAFGSASAPETVDPNMMGDYFASMVPASLRGNRVGRQYAKLISDLQEHGAKVNAALDAIRTKKASLQTLDKLTKENRKTITICLSIADSLASQSDPDPDQVRRLTRLVGKLESVSQYIKSVHARLLRS